jgi:heme/copper-type cytochrome/quinol oxidase subunit 2
VLIVMDNGMLIATDNDMLVVMVIRVMFNRMMRIALSVTVTVIVVFVRAIFRHRAHRERQAQD